MIVRINNGKCVTINGICRVNNPYNNPLRLYSSDDVKLMDGCETSVILLAISTAFGLNINSEHRKYIFMNSYIQVQTTAAYLTN